MTRIQRPGGDPASLLRAADAAAELGAAKKSELGPVEKRIQESIMAEPRRARRYERAVYDQDAKTIAALAESVEPVAYRELVEGLEEARKLGSAAMSFRALASDLAGANRAPEELTVDRDTLPEHFRTRLKMLDDVAQVERAIGAAGSCDAVGKFPLEQLESVKARLRADVARLTAARDKAIAHTEAPALPAAELATAEGAARALGRVLLAPELGQALIEAVARVPAPEREAFGADLAAFARVADSARSAPDYRTTRMGWQYPKSRMAYRASSFDPWVMYASEPRQVASREAAIEALVGVSQAAEPQAALSSALAESFVREIGVPAKKASGWKISGEAIRAAAAAEMLLPLRALNETVDDMAQAGRGARRSLFEGAPGLVPEVRTVVDEISRHVLEGDYRRWRVSSPASRRQLDSLDAKGLENWSDRSISIAADGLSSREEDDLGLFWVTKIGGPSHGFDYGGNCLLPLLANGRTRTILADDPRWSHSAAARCYLRLLPTADGAPTLYLEPTQRDFAHDHAIGGDDEYLRLQVALLRHAIAKAEAMGLPLSVPDDYEGALDVLGVRARARKERFRIEPSAGVFEASDTLGLGHDFVNNQRELTPKLERLWIETEGGS
jgi:hypothetical protein